MSWLSNDFTNNLSNLDKGDLNLVFDVLNILKSTKWNLFDLKKNIEKFLVENNLKMNDLGPILRKISTLALSVAENCFFIRFFALFFISWVSFELFKSKRMEFQ